MDRFSDIPLLDKATLHNRFEDLTKKILRVPKDDAEAEEAKVKARRARRRREKHKGR